MTKTNFAAAPVLLDEQRRCCMERAVTVAWKQTIWRFPDEQEVLSRASLHFRTIHERAQMLEAALLASPFRLVESPFFRRTVSHRSSFPRKLVVNLRQDKEDKRPSGAVIVPDCRAVANSQLPIRCSPLEQYLRVLWQRMFLWSSPVSGLHGENGQCS